MNTINNKNESERILMKERNIPDRDGILSSRITKILPDGTIQKDIGVPFCDQCGSMIKNDNLAICSLCHRKICPSCIIVYERRGYCIDCAKSIVSVTKREFIILYGLMNNVKLEKIKKYSHIDSKDIRQIIFILLETNLIVKKGFSIYTEYLLTDKGIALLPTCMEMYQREGDVQNFLLEVERLKTLEATIVGFRP